VPTKTSRGGRCHQRQRIAEADRAVELGPLGHHRDRLAPERARGERREGNDRDRTADPEADADGKARKRLAERQRDAGESPDAEGEDEGREAEAKEDSVEGGGDRHRHDAAPVLGELAADLWRDALAARLSDGGEESDDASDGVGNPAGLARDCGADQRDAAKGENGTNQSARKEGGAGGERRRLAASVTSRADRLDHGEAARRPGAGGADQKARADERDDHDGIH